MEYLASVVIVVAVLALVGLLIITMYVAWLFGP